MISKTNDSSRWGALGGNDAHANKTRIMQNQRMVEVHSQTSEMITVGENRKRTAKNIALLIQEWEEQGWDNAEIAYVSMTDPKGATWEQSTDEVSENLLDIGVEPLHGEDFEDHAEFETALAEHASKAHIALLDSFGFTKEKLLAK